MSTSQCVIEISQSLASNVATTTKTTTQRRTPALHEETQAYDRKCAFKFQMNNGSLYTSELDHELD
jgi:hypothetical protein